MLILKMTQEPLQKRVRQHVYAKSSLHIVHVGKALFAQQVNAARNMLFILLRSTTLRPPPS